MESSRRAAKADRIFTIFYFLLLAGFLLLFFIHFHPIIPFDSDDWLNATLSRSGVPDWGTWNPIKILPETFLRLSAGFGAVVLYPVSGNYLKSLEVSFALAVCLVMLAYFITFWQLIRERFDIGAWGTALVTTCFVLFHFMIFKSAQYDNMYLFWSRDATCYFHYVIPFCWNGALLFLFVRLDCRQAGNVRKIQTHVHPAAAGEKAQPCMHPAAAGMLVLAVYLGIFSNLFQSIVFVSYIGISTLLRLVQHTAPLGARIRALWKRFLIIALWVLSLVFEAGGGRAQHRGTDLSSGVLSSCTILVSWVHHLNGLWVKITALLTLIAVVLYIRGRIQRRCSRNTDEHIDRQRIGDADENITGQGSKGADECIDGQRSTYPDERSTGRRSSDICMMAVCGILTMLFLVLLCAVVSPDYLKRGDVISSAVVFLLVIVCYEIAWLCERMCVSLTLMPLVLFVMIVNCCSGSRIFLNSNPDNLTSETCEKIMSDMIGAVMEADEEGRESVQIRVPQFTGADNFPLSVYSDYDSVGSRMAQTMYIHGVTGQRIIVTTKPDSLLNALYGTEDAADIINEY